MFSKSSLFKIEYSINIETQCLKNIQLYSKPHFHTFTRKKGPLPLLPESPGTPGLVLNYTCFKKFVLPWEVPKSFLSAKNMYFFCVFLVHNTVALVLLSASVERFDVSHMWDFLFECAIVIARRLFSYIRVNCC